MLRHLAAALGLALLGAAVALAAVALHQLWWGLLLGVVATGAAMWALAARWWSRPAFGLGWTAMVGLLVAPRGEGDYVVSSDAAGYTLLGIGLVVLTASVASLGPARRVGRAGRGGPS